MCGAVFGMGRQDVVKTLDRAVQRSSSFQKACFVMQGEDQAVYLKHELVFVDLITQVPCFFGLNQGSAHR
jgi:hypothetical protein